jgi:hypothetical protein
MTSLSDPLENDDDEPDEKKPSLTKGSDPWAAVKWQGRARPWKCGWNIQPSLIRGAWQHVLLAQRVANRFDGSPSLVS